MTELNLVYSPADFDVDAQWSHRINDHQAIVIQDARPYGGNLPVNIWDEAEGCLYHFSESCTMASAYEAAARVLDMVEQFGGDVEKAHNSFFGC